MRATYANVTSTVALVVALGAGGAYAATQLPRNSVGTKQLKAHSVTAPKITKNAVTSAAIKDRTVTKTDLAPGVLPKTITTRYVGSRQTAVTEGERPLLTIPGFGTVTGTCSNAGGGLIGASVAFNNGTQSTFRTVTEVSSEDPDTRKTKGDVVGPGGPSVGVYLETSTVDNGHLYTLRTVDGSGLTLTVASVSKVDGGTRCAFTAEAFVTVSSVK